MLKNPIHITGAIRHCYFWLTSTIKDSFIPNPNYNRNTQSKTSIYCVHGTADRNASFTLIATRLLHSLPDNIDGIHLLAFNDRLKGTSIENFAIQMKDKIVSNHDTRVILMGHSRGGIIISWFKEYLAAANGVDIHKTIPIDAPFRGSPLALWPMTWLSISVKEMATDSDLSQQLSDQIRGSEDDYLFVGAEKDYIVWNDNWMPYHVNKTAKNCMLLDRHGHLSSLSSRRLVDRIGAEIWDAEEQAQERRLLHQDDDNSMLKCSL